MPFRRVFRMAEEMYRQQASRELMFANAVAIGRSGNEKAFYALEQRIRGKKASELIKAKSKQAQASVDQFHFILANRRDLPPQQKTP